MDNRTPQDTDSQSKRCTECKHVKPLSEFYTRSGMPHLYCSACKDCYKNRSKHAVRPPRSETLVKSEALAIAQLRRHGIPAAPGKAIYAADVDVMAFGCVRIEVKYARLDRRQTRESYVFRATPRQTQRGYLADVVLFICDDGDEPTYHLFPADHPVLFIKGRIKHGMVFVPGTMEATKHGNNRVVMTQPLMDAARNRWGLVWSALKAKSDALKQEGA